MANANTENYHFDQLYSAHSAAIAKQILLLFEGIKSKTMIFATHDPEWGLSYCSRILLLDDCKIKIDQKTTQTEINQITKTLQ